MGLRRTSFRSPVISQQQQRSGGAAVSPSQAKRAEGGGATVATVDNDTTTAPAEARLSPTASTSSPSPSGRPLHGKSTRNSSSSTKIAAETAAAATKPLRERGQSGKAARPSKKGVLAAASTKAVAAVADDDNTKEPVAVADPPQDPQDGMAPALTEPTAVPPTATTKADASSSPQPEIFEVADHPMPASGDATTMGSGGGEQRQPQPQARAAKRSKKDEQPLKELRSTRRRSNLHATPPVTNGKGGAKQQRWSTGGNGGTVAKGRREEEASQSTAPTPGRGKGDERPPEETNGGGGAEVADVNRTPEEASERGEGEGAINNNYLDRNKVPIITSSAVKDEGPIGGGAEDQKSTDEAAECNSGERPVIAGQEQQPGTGGGCGGLEAAKPTTPTTTVDAPLWNTLNGEADLQQLLMPPPQPQQQHLLDQMAAACPGDEDHQFSAHKSLATSDDALLEQIVLTTPTNKLTEQLCMVLKDQERALEQQEQQEQQQQGTTSNPSSQTMLKESADMDQLLGDMAATSELDLLQVFKNFDSGPVADDGAAAEPEGNLLALLSATDDDIMIVSPEKGYGAQGEAAAEAVEDPEAREIRERRKMLGDMEQELSQMQRRRDFLLRRLRKQQVQHMGRHLSEEVVGLFELSTRAASGSQKAAAAVMAPHKSYNNVKYSKGNGVPDAAAAGTRVAEDKGSEDVEDMMAASLVMRNDSPSSMLKDRDQTAVGHHPFIKPPSPKALRDFVQKVKGMAAVAERPAGAVLGKTATSAGGSAASLFASGGQGNHKVGDALKMRPGLLPLSRKSSTLDDGHRLQLANNVGLLRTELRIAEQAIDSEATASSSGGESADELINYSNTVQETLAIVNRAAWRYAQERARIASRWNWLTAEISDLEYRIRQHTDLHNQLRKSKGPVLVLRSADKDGDEGATAAPSNVNGYRGLLPGQYSSTKALDAAAAGGGAATADGFMADVENEVEGTASRTRPFQRAAFKKRKLVQTMNLHTISKKAARPSSVKCGCQWPQQPCALCTGRSDPTIPRPLPDMIPRLQRAALLDPCLHSCLSFPDDVSQAVRFEAIMADPQWQHKVLKSSKTALKSSIVAAAAAAGGTYKGLKLAKKEDVAKKVAGKKYTQGIISRYKKSKNKNRGTHTKYVQLLKQQNSRKAAIRAGLSVPLSQGGAAGLGGGGVDGGGEYESGVARSKNASPTHHYYRQDRIDRRSRNSYDIDNIVIPYSVAASTRVEILPYKEIPTPKWRLVDDTDLDEDIQVETSHYQQQQQAAASSDSNSSTITALEFDGEEYLEEYIQEKHVRALLEERKKFSTFLKFPYSTRSRANRRTDSRAESSGANTPDPASPAPHTPSIGADQESIPSPLCPSTPAPESVLESEASSQGPHCTLPFMNPSSRNERRRTISLKMLSHQNSTASDTGRPRSQTPEPSRPPFERLDYPLTDRKYEEMLRQMPLNHERLEEVCSKASESEETTTTAAAESASSSGFAATGSGGATKKARRGSLSGRKAVEDSDLDSMESPLPEEDPNDPEWVVPQEEDGRE